MRKTFFAVLISSTIVYAEDAQTYCDKLKKGAPFRIEKEEMELLTKGFNVETSVKEKSGHDSRVVTISYRKKKSNKKCEIIIDDGKISEIRR
ncbi:MAG: hypothetical protein A4S09_05215 [Proteobacteria bacterium SG_bin7]|nr:MAG: hypothetical protein A4S09_05215 [Proteobacteria bacterium SG_bin7]